MSAILLASCACTCGGVSERAPPAMHDAASNAADRVDPHALDLYARDLGTGLPYRVQLRVAIVDADTRASRTVADIACLVTYDLWDQVYVVRADDLAEPVKVDDLRRVPKTCAGVTPIDERARLTFAVPPGEIVTRASVSRVLPDKPGRRDIW